MTARLIVEQPGLMTTIQDTGRYGWQALGVPVSGALDGNALRLANALVGNTLKTAGMEIRVIGPTMRVGEGQVRVALVGTEAPIEILGTAPTLIPPRQSVLLAPDTVFRIGAIKDSGVCYLAVEGGFAITAELGSLSTYLPGKMGGIEGRALIQGDVIPVAGQGPEARLERRAAQEKATRSETPVHVVLGPQQDYFSAASLETFLNTEYTVSPNSNRMGLRLDGAGLKHTKGYNIASDGIVAGSIQVPGNGVPIVLLSDRQTTGGYPKIATVISADLPRLGRMMPGQKVRFSAIDVTSAEELRREAEKRFQRRVQAIEDIEPGFDSLSARLMRENLISGVVENDDPTGEHR